MEFKEFGLEAFRPCIFSKAEIGEKLIMAFMEMGPNNKDSGHDYPFEQYGIIVQDQIEMFIGDEHKIMTQNETYFIPAGVMHGWKTFDNPLQMLDITYTTD